VLRLPELATGVSCSKYCELDGATGLGLEVGEGSCAEGLDDELLPRPLDFAPDALTGPPDETYTAVMMAAIMTAAAPIIAAIIVALLAVIFPSCAAPGPDWLRDPVRMKWCR